MSRHRTFRSVWGGSGLYRPSKRMNKETGGVARQFVLGVVQSADGLPLMHTVHPGNVSETKTLQGMLQKVLARFPVQRNILVADCGLLAVPSGRFRRLWGFANPATRTAGIPARSAALDIRTPLWIPLRCFRIQSTSCGTLSRIYRHKRIESYIGIEHVFCLVACVERLLNPGCFLTLSNNTRP